MRHASLISAQARTQRGRNARRAATYLVLSAKFNQPLQLNLIGVGSTFRFLLRVNPKNSNRTSTRLAWKSGFVPKTYSALQTTEATRLGFEPRTRGPKPLVLPLHHRVNRSKGMNQSSPPNTRILLPWSRPGKRNSRENWANHADRPTPSKPGFTKRSLLYWPFPIRSNDWLPTNYFLLSMGGTSALRTEFPRLHRKLMVGERGWTGKPGIHCPGRISWVIESA